MARLSINFDEQATRSGNEMLRGQWLAVRVRSHARTLVLSPERPWCHEKAHPQMMTQTRAIQARQSGRRCAPRFDLEISCTDLPRGRKSSFPPLAKGGSGEGSGGGGPGIINYGVFRSPSCAGSPFTVSQACVPTPPFTRGERFPIGVQSGECGDSARWVRDHSRSAAR